MGSRHMGFSSCGMLLPEKRHLVKTKLFPQAVSYLEKTFQVRRPAGTILLSRYVTLHTGHFLQLFSTLPSPFCHNAESAVGVSGPVEQWVCQTKRESGMQTLFFMLVLWPLRGAAMKTSSLMQPIVSRKQKWTGKLSPETYFLRSKIRTLKPYSKC
ncbi:hypothetical protein J1605_008239 [Eschrichtius robustus]|uniref:Uncharacterized protein n=1 Tax=Eschrichtius robustus TaxID=9764 RepID=A0AB34H135_ESCRO|nr:hypothetical protein J1605_008239 [Eschrichtius robustus]